MFFFSSSAVDVRTTSGQVEAMRNRTPRARAPERPSVWVKMMRRPTAAKLRSRSLADDSAQLGYRERKRALSGFRRRRCGDPTRAARRRRSLLPGRRRP